MPQLNTHLMLKEMPVGIFSAAQFTQFQEFSQEVGECYDIYLNHAYNSQWLEKFKSKPLACLRTQPQGTQGSWIELQASP